MNICPQCGKDFDGSIEICSADHSKLISIDPTADPMLGRLLDGRYRLVKKIGEGGMGSIYRSVHTEMLRTCAIKLLTAVSPGNEDAVPRFKGEAKMASRIDNAHAVTIYDFGQSDDKILFLAMEFIDGKALSRVIAEERVLPIERVIHITNQIAEALTAAHALKIIHRDLKPDNIMITRKGKDNDFVKVLDFGIAKSVSEGSDNLTKTGFVLGTPVYMSPEQVLGEELDPRSDLYSLAIIVYEMLSGRLPFTGDNPQAIMMKRIISEPIRLRTIAPSISETVERVVMAGLEHDRDSRTPNVQIFAAELSQALHSGTQIMGGVVTGRLGDSSAQRDTQAGGIRPTRLDSSPAFTGQAEPSIAMVEGPSDPSAYAATELSPAGGQPPFVERPTREADQIRVSVPPAAAGQVITKPRVRPNKLIWAGGALAIAALAIVLYLILPSGASSGGSFTLIVKGAPAGSRVYINEVAQQGEVGDEGLTISGLTPGRVNVRVSHEGFADFFASLSGAKGQVQTCEAQLLFEIDYKGVMVPIPAGEFMMGDDRHEPDERPARQVSLPAYFIDKYEVTNAQYQKFCDATRRAYPKNPGFDANYFTGKPDYPVLGVTIEDAKAFAAWAGKRIPSEEEWEKAASWDPVAAKKRAYPWGDDFGAARANIATDRPVAATESAGDRSSYGVLNMAGNAGEWVDALYKPYQGNQTADPDYDKNDQVMRGGTFYHASTESEARTTYRNHLPRLFPAGFSAPVGIRCVVSADDPRIQQLVRERSK
ncbi:MAG TPA: bifunctional serine/threonine-protein kinase/formylglycine-generating enzyme family protein [Blastocatellia bacterium]|nr:bifunctional serine/threonine-protein kinase/formylglycine-generating enzyme family protein [Blastocatellia bacterium]